MKENISLISSYFPKLSELQLKQLRQLYDVYFTWNEQINVISRKDFEHFYERHVLHSLAIAKFIQFKPGTQVLDIGTGGGFPGIPLAIFFPDASFALVDSIGKKIKVVDGVAHEIGLHNVTAINERAENIKGKFDFIVSRAVTQMSDFLHLCEGKMAASNKHEIKNGIIYLKGGDLKEELAAVNKKFFLTDIPTYFKEEFFETKKIVYIPLN